MFNNSNSSSNVESTTVQVERLGIESLLRRLDVELNITFGDSIDLTKKDIIFSADWGFCHYYRLNTGEILIENLDEKCGVKINPQSRHLSVWSNKNIRQSQDRELWHQLIHYGVAAYLSDCGYTPIHAAAVVAPNGDSWLIGGQTHSGKSTLVLGLIEAGWQFLGDDGLMLAEEEGEIVAHAWLGTSLLDPILVETYPHLQSKLGNLVGDRQLIDLHSCYPNQWLAKTQPQGLLFPTFSPNTAIVELVPISAGIALGDLMSHAAMCLMEIPQPHLLHLQKLTNRCQHFNLLLGSVVQTQPSLVANILGSISN